MSFRLLGFCSLQVLMRSWNSPVAPPPYTWQCIAATSTPRRCGEIQLKALALGMALVWLEWLGLYMAQKNDPNDSPVVPMEGRHTRSQPQLHQSQSFCARVVDHLPTRVDPTRPKWTTWSWVEIRAKLFGVPWACFFGTSCCRMFRKEWEKKRGWMGSKKADFCWACRCGLHFKLLNVFGPLI